LGGEHLIANRHECRITKEGGDEIRIRATRDVGLYLARKLATDTGRTHYFHICDITVECVPEAEED